MNGGGKRRKARGAFLNTGKANCSIYESGRMVHECIMHSDRYTLDYLSLDIIDTALFGETGKIRRTDGGSPAGPYTPDYDFWVINWHFITMAMVLPVTFLDRLSGTKFCIVLELAPDDPLKLVPAEKFNGFIALEPDVERTGTIFPFPRPLEGQPRRPTPYDPARSPVIGSFGFDTPGKGFELLVESVNREFDRATVRINIPFGSYTSTYRIHQAPYAVHIAEMCRRIAKPGIEVVVTHDFHPAEAVIDWCGENDLNCFMYTRQQPGLSATTDQAILSGRPLLTLANDTFRHIHPYIPPYPELGFKEAIATTSDAVARMQRDWSKDRFRETFEDMLRHFGVLSAAPAVPTPPAQRRFHVLHACMDSGYRNNSIDYSRRLTDAMGRVGNWQVTAVPCSSEDELRAVIAVSEAEALVLSGADGLGRRGIEAAAATFTGPRIVVTDDPASWASAGLAAVARRPIVPFHTLLAPIAEGPPTVWLVGFGDPASALEQAIAKVASELPSARIMVEADPTQVPAVEARLDPVRLALDHRAIECRSIPPDGVATIETFAVSSFVVIHDDPARSREIETYTSLAMVTERAVVFSRRAPAIFTGEHVVFENSPLPAMMELGTSAQIKLVADYGEWQIAAEVRTLCRKLADDRPADRNPTRTAAHILSLPGDNTFLHAAYWALLGRAADPHGLRTFVSQLAAGRSRESVLLDLSQSDEARARALKLPGIDDVPACPWTSVQSAASILAIERHDSFVHAAFWALLGRPLDDGGFAHFVSQVEQGRRRGGVLLELSRSPEAKKYGVPLPGIESVAPDDDPRPIRSVAELLAFPGGDEFLFAAYRILLGRAPDLQGLSHFTSQLAAGRSRGAILVEISKSPEAQSRGASLAGLERLAPHDDPRPVRTATDVLSRRGDDAFLEAAYRALFGRKPDPAGIRCFLGQLIEGKGRAAVLREISQSAEARLRGAVLPGIDDAVDVPRARSASEVLGIAADAGFIRAAFEALLGRLPDAEGAAHYECQLREGRSRESILLEIARSMEARERKLSLPGIEAVRIAREDEGRDIGLRCALRAAENRLHRIVHETAAAPIAPLRTPGPLRFAAPVTVPAAPRPRSATGIDFSSAVRTVAKQAPPATAAGRTIFLLTGIDHGDDASAAELATAWRAHSDLRTVVWHMADRKLRFADGAEVVKDACPASSWLVVPRSLRDRLVTAELVEVDVIMQANRLGLRTAFAFYGADPLRHPEHAGPGSNGFESYVQALLLADVVLPVSDEAGEDLTAVLTQHHLATWGPVIETVPWPKTGEWDRYAATLDTLLRDVADSSRRIASLYYWIETAVPEEVAFAVQLARALAERGVKLIPMSKDGSAEHVVQPGPVAWSGWVEPGTAGAPPWVLSPSGMPPGLRAVADSLHSRGVRIAVLTGRTSGREELEALPRADKIVALSPEQLEEIHRFLLSSRIKVHSAEDRFKVLRSPDQAAIASRALSRKAVAHAQSRPEVSEGRGGVPAAAALAIHSGGLNGAEVLSNLWRGVPPPAAGTNQQMPSDDGESGTRHRWIDFARNLLAELAADRLRDECRPLPPSRKRLAETFPNLVTRRPLLSVCLSTYNRAGWVKRNLENVYSQISGDRDDVEIFVVDNTSPDNTPEAVEPYRAKRNFRYHRNVKNVGMLGNLAVTAQCARGQYVWILGDDDLTRRDCIRKVLDVLHRHPGIGLVYLNYGYTSEPDPLSIKDLPAFLDAYNVLEPPCPDELSTVKGIAAKCENFYTAIYAVVFRRDHAMRAYCQNTSGRPFSSMLTCIPTSYYVLHYMPDEPAYWIGEPSLVVNSRVSWQAYGTLFDMEQLPRAWDLAERNGAEPAAVDRRRANRLWLVAMMWKELFEDDRANNTPWFSAPRVLMRVQHLPEIERYIPEMREIYTRAHHAGHPGAAMPPQELFVAFAS